VERPATKYNLKNIRQVNYYRKTILQEYDWVYYLNLSELLNLRGVSRMKYRLGFCDLPIIQNTALAPVKTRARAILRTLRANPW
jgi:hypothetical protein